MGQQSIQSAPGSLVGECPQDFYHTKRFEGNAYLENVKQGIRATGAQKKWKMTHSAAFSLVVGGTAALSVCSRNVRKKRIIDSCRIVFIARQRNF